MPIHADNLLTDLKKWVARFEDDLREQCKEVPELDERLKAQYEQAKSAKRTAFAYSVWRDGELTQSAVGWVLSSVFIRFLEDNDLLERTFLSGVGENRDVAEETKFAWVREHGKGKSDNDYLAHAVREVGKLPGMADLMDARHNALWNAAISPDAAKEFIEFWRRIDPDTGKMAHQFTDPEWDTRFLGDLYQDLSESARKKYALLQTPDFVEEFILDRTLDPAIGTFGLKEVRMIDPTCGSGHFLLGGFRRLLGLWEKERADLSERELAVKALHGVYGVDINPFAVAIARFRLLLAAWRYCGVKQLKNAPDFKANLAVGDSLLHGARFDSKGQPYVLEHQTLFGGEEEAFQDELAHCFEVEDAKELHRILGQQYHAVVGNPPYITVKDTGLKALYKNRYDSCHGRWVLSVPFVERFFDLTISGPGDHRESAGFIGQITANSFMKRSFGKKLIEEFIPRWDLTHVIDTGGAYIPGHGTPTVILFGRNTKPRSSSIRSVMGIEGEPGTPKDPARGKVWTAIVNQIDQAGSESAFISVGDTDREKFHSHPWNIGGGGVSELKEYLDKSGTDVLKARVTQIGITAVTGEDDIYLFPDKECSLRNRIEHSVKLVEGNTVRNFSISESLTGIWLTVDGALQKVEDLPESFKLLWTARSNLSRRKRFGTPMLERGLTWYEWQELYPDKLETPLSIVFPDLMTDNHFVLDRGGSVFKSTAPVIKLKNDSDLDDYLRLLGALNSSVVCFWLKQVWQNKGSTVDERGARQRTAPFEDFYQFNCGHLKKLPLTSGAPTNLAREIDRLAKQYLELAPMFFSSRDEIGEAALSDAKAKSADIRARMVSLQEELDWQCYRHYGLIDDSDDLEWPEDQLDELPPLQLGERTFEIFMARQMARGTLETTWFERHKESGSKPITEPPAHWPEDYVALYHRRHEAIQSNKNLNLIERPEYKRRWNTEPWAKRQEAALRKWLLTRLEAYFHDADRMVAGEDDEAKAAKLEHLRPIRSRFAGGSQPQLVSIRQLAGAAQSDSQWMEAATVYSGRDDFKVAQLVEKLVLDESVPVLPADRYKPTGLRKRIEWETTWQLQRKEDEVEVKVRKEHEGKSEEELKELIRKAQLDQVGDIPVPPKYASKDFAKTTYWKLRGKLDVPKERWVLYTEAEGGHDDSPVIAWAGWDHAQQAEALTGFYQQATETWGWDTERLARLLAALKDLLPWLHQWHNDLDPEYGDRISTTYQDFYDTERQAIRLTEEDIEGIRMPDG